MGLLVVSVGGFDYDVTTFTGSYNDNASKFHTSANGGVMPWWENYNPVNNWTTNLASDFALEVEYSLGSGVLFAYELRPQFNSTQAAFYVGTNIPFGTETLYGSSATWAQATLIGPTSGGGGGSADVPGPLPALGLAAAFGFSRKLRKRIKASSNTVSKINPTTNTVTATVTVGANPYGVAFDGTNIWVTNNGSNTVTKLRAGS